LLDIGFTLPYDREGRNVGGGFFEFGFILFIAFLIFGPKKLPEIARVLGKGLAELRRASYELRSSLEEEIRNLDRPQDDYRPALPESRPTYGYNHSESASRESESGS
jgi:TatA/E family protein of Tat protein translocase